MPNIPTAFNSTWDWKQKAIDYDTYAFNRDATATYMPLWWDNTNINFTRTIFGLPSYVGWAYGYPGNAAQHEAYSTLGSVLGSLMVGINKSYQDGNNYVQMCENYFNSANGQNLFLMWTSTVSGGNFWTDLYPNILAYGIKHYAGGLTNAEMYTVATRWRDCIYTLGGANANFNYMAFDFATMSGVTGSHIEPDAPAGIAYLCYLSYVKFGDTNHLQAADWALQYFENRAEASNPLYENILPYGAYACARMNAELGRTYNLHKIVNWCFGQTTIPNHYDWGMITKNFGSYGAHGLMGMRNSSSYYNGYAFAMDTFSFAPPLVAMVRYDDRYARAIGKWMGNALNNARLFYSDSLPSAKQDCYTWVHTSNNDPENVYCYEGIKCNANGQSPYASGDAIAGGWASTNLAIYGSSHVGFFGGIATRTNNSYIWRLDCLKGDMFRSTAYPTYLYYNPHSTAAWVQLNVGTNPTILYDQVSNNFLATANNQTTGTVSFQIPADSAVVVVLVPEGSTKVVNGQKTTINGVPVDFIYM